MKLAALRFCGAFSMRPCARRLSSSREFVAIFNRGWYMNFRKSFVYEDSKMRRASYQLKKQKKCQTR
jgi:hypothetical protein